MKFPKIFTENDKQRALLLKREFPESKDSEIIAAVVKEIHSEIAQGKPCFLGKFTAKVSRKKRPSSNTRRKRIFLRRLPGSFESASR